MNTIQIINLHGNPAAIAVNGTAVIAQHVPAAELAHIQAKALYALEIQAGERAGPYTDTDAENYARRAAAAVTSSPSTTRPRTLPRQRGRRRQPPAAMS